MAITRLLIIVFLFCFFFLLGSCLLVSILVNYLLCSFIYEQHRCNYEDILLEMDRILRPEGAVIFRDEVDVLVKVKKIIDSDQVGCT